MGEHFPLTGGVDTAIARHPHAQAKWMPDHRHISHIADHGVAVDTLDAAARTMPLAIIEQVAKHHRGLAVDGSIGDRHPKFDRAHDRVGNNSSRTRRRLGQRAPRKADGKV